MSSYIKNDEIEEDKQHVHHNAHNELELADHPSGVLQGVRQILALLVYLQQGRPMAACFTRQSWNCQGAG